MREKIFIINFFDKNEMKWYENEESNQTQVVVPFQSSEEHRYEHTKWYHETGKPPIEVPIDDSFTEEFVQLPPLLEFQEFEEYMPLKENKE
ncbi:hypothetical protein [Oceanirhabdus seepicola]|uniref:Uncharacterized protein n=1 Tax=Oceanirhabdus seepicola TaxID=2828781 RepID=A0A9J6PAQ3_9CLOT|nr:hypothetical protein [Oceanirhabdus seepicola]MCM1992830.1 hypothetical protein [Oceanirhabdus seepicola]